MLDEVIKGREGYSAGNKHIQFSGFTMRDRSVVVFLVIFAVLFEVGGSQDARSNVAGAMEERIRLKTRNRSALSNVGEGGVGIGQQDEEGVKDTEGAKEGNADKVSWRDKAAERLGLPTRSPLPLRKGGVSAGKVGGRAVSKDGDGQELPNNKSLSADTSIKQIPAEIIYQAKAKAGKGLNVNKIVKVPRGKGGPVKAAVPTAKTSCNVTMECHVCPEAAVRDSAEYCVQTGWRQQVSCKNSGGVVVEVYFESCKCLALLHIPHLSPALAPALTLALLPSICPV